MSGVRPKETPWVKTRLVEDGSMVQAIKTTHTLPVMSFFGFHHLKVSQRIFWVKQMNNCVTKTHTKTHSQLHAIVTLNNDESFTAWCWMFFFREKPIQSQTFKFINTQVELAQYLFNLVYTNLLFLQLYCSTEQFHQQIHRIGPSSIPFLSFKPGWACRADKNERSPNIYMFKGNIQHVSLPL